MAVYTTATINEPVSTVPKFYLNVYIIASVNILKGVLSGIHSPFFCKKNHNVMHMIVENCSMAMTSATHHYIVKISPHMY